MKIARPCDLSLAQPRLNVLPVLAREGGARRFNHPRDGLLRYEQVTLVPAAHPDRKLVMLLPAS